MKKIISLISIIAILITSLMIFASCGGVKAPADTDWETVGDIQWKYDAGVTSGKEKINILHIKSKTSGTPVKMKDYEKSADLPWKAYSAYVTKIELTDISVVSDKAFYGMSALKAIDFGNKLTEIGDLAFAFCTSLTKVTIPEGVTAIGDSAFEACASLESVEMPSTLKTLGDRAFAYSSKLKTFTIDEKCLEALPQAEFDGAFIGIDTPEIVKTSPEAEKPSESDKPSESEKPDESDKTDESEKDTDEKETEKKDEAPENNVVKIIAVIVLALVIIGLIVGGILLARSNKNQTKDARTVRKNDGNEKADKKSDKNAKSNKGKKK